jgi:hypothetical protein
MRFSLRTLFWIFPVTLVAYGLAYIEASLQYIDTVPRANYWLRRAQENAQAFAEYQKQNGIQFDVEALNQWLHKTLAPNHPQESVLAAVALDAQGNPQIEQTLAERVGFYAVRPDRTPSIVPDMNEIFDTCTFNSWNTTFEEAREYDHKNLDQLIQTRALANWPWALVLLGIFILAVMPMVDSALKKIRAKGTQDQTLPDADKVWPLR